MKRNQKYRSPVMLAVIEARKEGQFVRSTTWGGKPDARKDRKQNKKELRNMGDE
jgi:hypothetical protein